MTVAKLMMPLIMAGIVLIVFGINTKSMGKRYIGAICFTAGWYITLMDIKSYIDQGTGKG